MKHSLTLLALCGCSSFGNMTKVAEPRVVVIEWVRELPKDCNGIKSALGCAYVNTHFTFCKIVMPENAPDFVVAEEFRHCFGEVHK